MGSPHGEPVVRVRHGGNKNCSGEEWKGLKIVSKCLFSPSGNASKRRNALFPRAGSPPISSLPALQVGYNDDVQDAEDYACREQSEFDGHIRGHTNSALRAGDQPLDSRFPSERLERRHKNSRAPLVTALRAITDNILNRFNGRTKF